MNFFGPNTIFYPVYLVSALLLTLLWLKITFSWKFSKGIKVYFSKEIWFSRSFLVDLVFCLIFIFILRLMLAPYEEWLFQSSLIKVKWALNHLTLFNWSFKIHFILEGILATIITMLSIDFASYVVHRFMHTQFHLKKIHLVHHSATQLNLFTTHRQHPLEPFILNGSRSIAAAIGLGIFHWFFIAETPVMTIHGLGLGFFIYMFTVNLHHSHIPVCYPRFIRCLLLSPHVHHLHHSKNPKHFNKNFGVIFSIWDRLFETYLDEEVHLNELHFGVDINEEQKLQSTKSILN